MEITNFDQICEYNGYCHAEILNSNNNINHLIISTTSDDINTSIYTVQISETPGSEPFIEKDFSARKELVTFLEKNYTFRNILDGCNCCPS